MSNAANEVIDLTDSFTLADHGALSNVIIDLDDSHSDFSYSSVSHNSAPRLQLGSSISVTVERSSAGTKKYRRKKSSTPINKGPQEFSLPPRQVPSYENRSSSLFGDCPICWDELGKNPLASTKCGHVFCLKCLEQSLDAVKKCPACRTALKGKTSYHPLYLGRD